MDLYTLLRIVVRRWLVAGPVAALTLLLGVQTLSSMKPEYEAKGSLLLLAPTQSTGVDTAALRNPFLQFNNSLKTTAIALQAILSQDNQRRLLASEGLSRGYTIATDQTTSPILTVTAKSSRKATAIATVKGVMATIDRELESRQTAVQAPPDLRIKTDVLLLPSNTHKLLATRNRTVAATLALGLAAVLGSAVVAESWSTGRAAARRTRREDDLTTIEAPDVGDEQPDLRSPALERSAASVGGNQPRHSDTPVERQQPARPETTAPTHAARDEWPERNRPSEVPAGRGPVPSSYRYPPR